jgi:RND family efflux transporter MFP subunit
VLPVIGLLTAGVVAGGAYYHFFGGHRRASAATTTHAVAAGTDAFAMPVEVAHPRKGGVEHTTRQPGSVHAFEYAHLYAKVSGYLKMQKVDIGDPVQEGEVLAEIDDPELEETVKQAQAALNQAEAMQHQAEVRIKTAEAVVKAAKAQIQLAKADVEKTQASLTYRGKALKRITDLARRQAIEQKLVDESQDQADAALAAYHAAQAGEGKAVADEAEAEAKLEQAHADLEEAKATVEVASANLRKAKVMFDYTSIVSPYTGVVTQRNFHRGDFIRSASDGTATPLLAVARTDKMRVIIRVPDKDVPYLDVGDPATIQIDALGGKAFQGKVSRYAHAETPEDRTMRTEVDLPNTNEELSEGMYGGATIVLEPPSMNMTISSSALIEHKASHEGTVYVVKDGVAHLRTVQVGRDNGVDVEILEGLSPDDQVVTVYNGSLSEGVHVRPEPAKEAQGD